MRPDETLISRDAKAYHDKRELIGYEGDAAETCELNCVNCDHGITPYYVVIDVTNRCNMNCPICLANIPAMGMEFNPPLEYFDSIFSYLRDRSPVPKIQLFGGEPTCREDLWTSSRWRKTYGLHPRVVTNGLQFRRRGVLQGGARAPRAQLMLGLDGVNPEIQKKLRKNPGSLREEAARRSTTSRSTSSPRSRVMCTTAPGISEELLPGLIELCYEKRDLITRIMLIPLQATAGPETGRT